MMEDDPYNSESTMSVILCTAGYDHTIRFWEALTGLCQRTLQCPDSQVNRLVIAGNKRILAVAAGPKVKLYNLHAPANEPYAVFSGHSQNVTSMAFHAECRWMVTSSEDGTVKIWDLRTREVSRNHKHGCTVWDVVIHPNQGEIISGDANGNVVVWDLAANRRTHQWIPEEGVGVSSVDVANDGSLLVAANKAGNVFIWRMDQELETTTLTPVARFQAHRLYISRIIISPDVRHICTCSADCTAKVWGIDLAALEEDREKSRVSQSVSSKSSTSVLNGGTQKSSGFPLPMPVLKPQPQSSAQAQNGQLMASLAASLAQSLGGAVPTMSDNDEQPTPALSANPSQKPAKIPMLVAPPDLIPAPGFPLEYSLKGHQRWVWDAAWSADSAYVVTASSDHFARLFELGPEGKETMIRQYHGHHRGLTSVALNDYSENM